MDVRRVVTGHDADGNAIFVSDGVVAPITLALLPGSEFHRLWAATRRRRFPMMGPIPKARGTFRMSVGSGSVSSRSHPMAERARRLTLTSQPRSQSLKKNCRAWASTWNRANQLGALPRRSTTAWCSPAERHLNLTTVPSLLRRCSVRMRSSRSSVPA